LLQEAGYGISEVKLNAAFHGVPQVRKRFFAIGRLDAGDGFLDAALEGGRSLDPLTVRRFLDGEAARSGEDERVDGHFDVDFYYRHPRNWGRRAVFSVDEPSPTVRSTNRPVAPGYRPHPQDPAPADQVRALTPQERARIQTFPISHVFEGTRTDIDMMVANAVPTRLAAHVAGAIMEFEAASCVRPDDQFRVWLRTSHDYTPRAAGDVLSRLRRLRRMLGEADEPAAAPEDALRRLRHHADYSALTPAVKSQMKRAIELHQEFAGNGGG
jgi:DNA (cytosine-5)-methyltransferase 1